MFLMEFLQKFEKSKIQLFVDMDGVIADYDMGNPYDYDIKRPLYDSINKLKEISKMSNVQMNILSVTKGNKGIDEKNNWLDRYAPFFKEENRNILSKEMCPEADSSELKANFLKEIVKQKHNEEIIIIDDDPRVLKLVQEVTPEVHLLKDTVLVD